MSMRRPGRLSCVIAVSLAFAAHAEAQSVDTIASGLSNPRGIAFAPNGELFVVEMGVGGQGPCIESRESLRFRIAAMAPLAL